jgi:hypothetical protein
MIRVVGIIGFLAGLLTAAWFKPKPAPPPAAHSEWTALGTGGASSAESVDADWTRQIFRQVASGRFFEIRSY